MWSGSEAGSYLRLIDSCITQLKVQGPSRTCNESTEEEEDLEEADALDRHDGRGERRDRPGRCQNPPLDRLYGSRFRASGFGLRIWG